MTFRKFLKIVVFVLLLSSMRVVVAITFALLMIDAFAIVLLFKTICDAVIIFVFSFVVAFVFHLKRHSRRVDERINHFV